MPNQIQALILTLDILSRILSNCTGEKLYRNQNWHGHICKIVQKLICQSLDPLHSIYLYILANLMPNSQRHT